MVSVIIFIPDKKEETFMHKHCFILIEPFGIKYSLVFEQIFDLELKETDRNLVVMMLGF